MGHFRVRDLSTRVKSHMNYKIMEDFTRVKSPMKILGRFYLSKKTPDYKKKPSTLHSILNDK